MLQQLLWKSVYENLLACCCLLSPIDKRAALLERFGKRMLTAACCSLLVCVHCGVCSGDGLPCAPADSADTEASSLGAVPAVDQNGFIVAPGGSGPGAPAASWQHDYTKEAQRLIKWRAMLGAWAKGLVFTVLCCQPRHTQCTLERRGSEPVPALSADLGEGISWLTAFCVCSHFAPTQHLSAPPARPRNSVMDQGACMAGTGTADWKRFLARHPNTVKRRVRKGIPDRLRGLAWQLLSGGRDLLMQNEGVSHLLPRVAAPVQRAGLACARRTDGIMIMMSPAVESGT